MLIARQNVHLHSMSVHFTSALYPVAVFFLFLSFFYRAPLSLFAYYHLFILATLSAPVSYLTGTAEWRQKFRGARVRIFTRKITAGVMLIPREEAAYHFYLDLANTTKHEGTHKMFLQLAEQELDRKGSLDRFVQEIQSELVTLKAELARSKKHAAG